MMRAACLAVVSVVLAVGNGCGTLPKTRYYILEPPRVAAAVDTSAATKVGLSVGIVPFQVDAPYDQDRIVYRVGENSPEVGYYAYHRWAAPLSRMLPGIVARAFGDVTGIGLIEPAAPGRNYDATLRGRVLALEEVDSAGGAHVRMSLTLTLVDANDQVLWADSLTSEETPRPADDVPQIVARARTTLNKLLLESATNLTRTLTQ